LLPVAEIVVFHHALGLTAGVLAFAGALRDAGHIVHTPDLYEGRVFPDLASGVGHAEQIGFGTVVERGEAAAAGLPPGLVYAGFSLGVLPAQKLAQTRAGSRAALLYHSAAPLGFFGGSWPEGVPVQIHFMADDPWAAEDSEAIAALRDRAGAEVFVYPGAAHLFADSSLPDYDAAAAGRLLERTLGFLARLG
jgi:dienelactone hydrolase